MLLNGNSWRHRTPKDLNIEEDFFLELYIFTRNMNYKRFKELLHLYMHELLYFKDVQPRNNVIFSHTTLPK